MLADDGIGEWGFAALVEADGRKILFDTGARPNTVLENARELKLDLSDVQDVILSTFMTTTTSGLLTLRREFPNRIRQRSRAFTSPMAFFLERRGQNPNPMIQIKKISRRPAAFLSCMKNQKNFFPVSGSADRYLAHIPKKIIPRARKSTQDRMDHGHRSGRSVPGLQHSAWARTALRLRPFGIINTLQYARGFLRPAPVDAAIGGFHLFAASDQQLAWTAPS